VRADAGATLKFCPKEPVFEGEGNLGKLILYVEASAAWGLYSYAYENEVLKEIMPYQLFKFP
jgi:hypothetical protein